MASETAVLRASGVHLKLGDSDVLRGLDLEIERGECFAVVGPGGCGKTSLLKCLAGLHEPQRGTVRFRGEPVHGISRNAHRELARRLGMSFQHGGLFDSLTVAQNLEFPLREVLRLPRSEYRGRIREALKEVELEGTEERMLSELSGGMQKRLGIARARMLSPELIFYDDPTAGLDPVTSRTILELIETTRRRDGVTVVMVVSDPSDAYGLADRMGLLHGGAFVAVDTVEAIRSSRNPLVRQFLDGDLEGPLHEVDA